MTCTSSIVLGILLVVLLGSAIYSVTFATNDNNYTSLAPGSECVLSLGSGDVMRLMERPAPALVLPRARLLKAADGAKRLQLLAKAPKRTMLMCYADWCGHCKQFKPTFLKAAEKLPSVEWSLLNEKGNAPVMKKLGVTGFPTVYMIEVGSEPVRYSGPRTIEGLVEFAQKS